MALRARLVAPPPPPPNAWVWHHLRSASIKASALFSGDRRMEAETYLSTGYGLRIAIESKSSGWVRFDRLARVTQPGRLKGILVAPEYGNPFLTATQVFDVRPIPRKFLALEKTTGAKACFVEDGTILVTRSGSVGRATIAHNVHRGIVLSDDLLRVQTLQPKNAGWIYAYLHAPQVRAMTKSAHYGHIIKHLEISHLDALPVPTTDEELTAKFNSQVSEILALRNEAYLLTLEAESQFEKALGLASIESWGEAGFSVKASDVLFSGRRRLDAAFHNPGIATIRHHLAQRGLGFTAIRDAEYNIWLPNRSGQVYGIIGSVILAENDLEDKVISDDAIRIQPKPDLTLRPGYLITALSHPILGRPLVKALAYGSSIPHIDVSDIAAHKIVRINDGEERAIAELAEASAKARASADLLEQKIAEDAATIIEQFIAKV